MKQKKNVPVWLRWPWDLVVYVALVVLLRLFAIPVILLLMAWKKKRQPDGPEEGYCLQRTRRRLARLAWALLFLAIGVLCGVYVVGELLIGDRSSWELSDYAILVVGALLSVGALAAAIYEAYTDLRDVLFPERSRLAKSIRAQLPYPEEAPGVKELFAMVDRDIQENGQWFDRVAVGREWVFGDDVTAIDRIRAVFGRDELVRRYTGNNGSGPKHTRVVELYILDDRHQVQITGLRDPRELPPLLDCLKLRAPEALFLPYDQFVDYNTMDDEAWQKVLQEYRLKRGRRKAETARPAHAWEQNMVLTREDGTVTSRVTPELVRQLLTDGMAAGGEVFSLTPGRPVVVGEQRFSELECVVDCDAEEGEAYLLRLKEAPGQPGRPPEQGLVLFTSQTKAEAVLLAWLRGESPGLEGWQPVRLYSPQNSGQGSMKNQRREAAPPHLVLVSSQGVRQGHGAFTQEDIQLAAEGIADGSYKSVDLLLPGGWLWMEVVAGDELDGRCTVTATRPDPDQLRWFTTRCTHRQAADWLLEFSVGQFRPQGEAWKDCTKQMLG